MNNLRKLFGIISIIAIIACAIAACDLIPNPNPNPNPGQNQTPVAGDYDIGNLTQTVGNVTAVTITPKSGKSSGARTIYYAGTGGTTYAKSMMLPAAAGTYAVTFNVAAASGWDAAIDLSAGTLTIGNQTPVSGDYEFSGLTQTAGKVKGVIITPKTDKSSGARTIYYEGTSGTSYTKNTALPQQTGTYAVTFDVAAVTGWNQAAGLSAGNLVINTNETPFADDYEIGNLTQTFGSVTAVTITPKPGKITSSGAITIYYEGYYESAGGITKSTKLPTAAGTFAVTFDVAAVTGWNQAANLPAGTLEIKTTQAHTVTVTIAGTPNVGKRLQADVLKNFSGKTEYQWYVGGDALKWETGYEYTPNPRDVGKKIKVTVKCGDATAESPEKTVQMGTFTAAIQYHGWYDPINNKFDETIYASIRFPDADDEYYQWPAKDEDAGLSVKWLRNGTVIPGETEDRYSPTAEDKGKNIKAVVSGHGQNAESNEHPVAPPIEYENNTDREKEYIEKILQDIEIAYKLNRHNCKTLIDSYDSWRVDFCEEKADRRAEVKNGKLVINISCKWYDDDVKNNAADTRFNQIGAEINIRISNIVRAREEYRGNMIRLADRTQPQPQTLAERRSAVITIFS
jgi:hypothetical protein